MVSSFVPDFLCPFNPLFRLSIRTVILAFSLDCGHSLSSQFPDRPALCFEIPISPPSSLALGRFSPFQVVSGGRRRSKIGGGKAPIQAQV